MMPIARITYLIGLLTTLVMIGAALTAPGWAATRATDVQAYATFAGLAAAGTLVAYHRAGSGRHLWMFLVAAAVCAIAGSRDLPVFWLFGAGYGAAGGGSLWIATGASSDVRLQGRPPADPWRKG